MNSKCMTKERSVNNISSEIIDEFVEVRESCGVSQKQLSELSGVTQAVIARLERSVHSPQLNTFLKVLEPLGYTLKVVPKENR